MGRDPLDFVRLAKWFLEFSGEVEFNCCCPSPTVFGNVAASSLLSESEKFRIFIATIVREMGPHHLSVKMRTGIFESNELMRPRETRQPS